MRRALACFVKQGLQTDPYPVDYKTKPEKEKGDFWVKLLPSLNNMMFWNLLMKEWVGYIAYKMRGLC